MDEYLDTEHEGWFSRLIGSIKSVGIGVLLFLIAFPLLWWNEGRAVQTAESLDEGQGAVTSVEASKVDAANEGKLVHLTGTAKTADVLNDSDFGISRKGIKLMRTVEMYQWVETKKSKSKKKLGGGKKKTTKYSYTLQWSDVYRDSSEFEYPDKYRNPPLRYIKRTITAQHVDVGAFRLPPAMSSKIGGAQPISLSPDDRKKVTPVIKSKTRVVDDAFYIRPTAKDKQFDVSKPKLGDHRVRFSLLLASEVSIVAQQVGSSFQPYKTKAGGELSMIKEGRHSSESMFTAAQEGNTTLTWILRLVGWLMMVLGIGMVFRPLAVIADVIPLFGSILEMGIVLMALALATPLALLVIAIAWVAARPLIGGLLLTAVVGMIVGIVLLVRKRKQAKAVA